MLSRRRPERTHAPALRRVVGAAILGPLLACAAQFQPTVPMRARTQDVEVELSTLKAGASREFTFVTRSTTPHTLGSGWLTVASRHPCSGGADLDQVSIDDVPTSADGTLAPGRHHLKARLDRAGGDFTLDLVVDVRLDEHGCLRAPALSQLLPLEAPQRPLLITSMGSDVTNDLSGLRSVSSFQLGAGLWVRQVLLSAHGGVGLTSCQAQTCGKTSGEDLRNGLALPFAAEARLTVASPTLGMLRNFLAVGVRYSFLTAWLPTLTGERRLGVHGIQGVLSWSFAEGLRGPFQHLERASTYELTFPLGIFVDPDAPNRPVAFAGGFAFRLLLPL